MLTTHLLYLHGFLSSPASTKARMTAAAVRQRHPSAIWHCPMLAASPGQAMVDVMDAITHWPRETTAIVGSSLGGFYATWLAEQLGCRAVLLNPAVRPARDLAPHVGKQTLWHEPDTHFVLEPHYIDELHAMELDHISRPERYFAVIAKGDEVLDWREMHQHYSAARIKLLDAGDHALSDYEQHLGEVLEFLQLV